MAACNVVLRSSALAVAALTARSEHGRVRRRWVPPLATGLFTIEAAWVARRFARRGTSHDEVAAAIDVVTSLLALVAEAFAHGHRRRPGGPRLGIDYAAGSLTFACTETADPWRLGMSALAVGSTYSRLVDGSVTARINDLAIMTSGIALQPLLGRYRSQADKVDAARDRALRQAEELATQRERQRQRRVLHDSALQLLEAISAGWTIDDDLLLARIDDELERLGQLLADEPFEKPADLGSRLDQLAADLQQHGVEVTLEVAELDGRSIDHASVDALGDALREALVNVQKHAGATQVRITASTPGDRVKVTIIDDGCGFDPSAPTPGFGIRESISGRLKDIGGAESIDSTPGRGTRVTLEAPR
jgi:signal transduction histidine kinase